jgi:hypothetical protein
MGFEKQATDRDPKRDPLEEKIQKAFLEIFDNNTDPKIRYSEFLRRMQIFFVVGEKNRLLKEDINEIKVGLEKCCAISDREQFLEECLACVKPLIDWMRDDYASFEAMIRENQIAGSGFTPLNESVSYGKDKNLVHIHVSPSESFDPLKKLSILRDGFKKLAKILKEDESIKEVTASSWIIAENPRIMEMLGFTVLGEISPEFKEKHFKYETRSVFEAVMSREDFLKKYGE